MLERGYTLVGKCWNVGTHVLERGYTLVGKCWNVGTHIGGQVLERGYTLVGTLGQVLERWCPLLVTCRHIARPNEARLLKSPIKPQLRVIRFL